jgi:thiamine-phosphate pyrophosphorylase
MVDFRFYLITDRKRCSPRSLQAVIGEACDLGVTAVQLREKDLRSDELVAYVQRLSEITHKRNAKLFINRGRPVGTTEDAFLAASIGSDGFHFPESIAFPHELKRRFPKLLVGMSTHSANAAVVASTEGADFVTFGPVFETESKKAFGPPLGLDGLRAVSRASSVPVFAIGGITPDNTADCIAAGAHGVAAIGAIMESSNLPATLAAFKSALGTL